MKKSGNYSEEFYLGILDRLNSYSDSETVEGKINSLTDVVVNIILQLRENKLITKKQLKKFTKKYPEYEV